MLVAVKYLCAYIVAERKLTVSEISKYLSLHIPDYMIPSYFVHLDQLPLTANGKLDKKALPEPDGNIITGKKYVAPRNETEEEMVEIWSEILGIEKIGMNDSFFDLGGNSIKLITLTNLINKRFATEIRTVDLFHLTTIRQISEMIDKQPEEVKVEMVEYSL